MATFNNPYQQYNLGSYTPLPQTQLQQSFIIWVKGEQEANVYPMGRNQTVPLWDSTDKVIFLKQSDANGVITMQILRYEIEAPQVNTPVNPEYMTKKDFESWANTFTEQISGMLKMKTSKSEPKFEEG